MNRAINAFITLLLITFGILYLYYKPLVERLMSVLYPFEMILIAMGIAYFGATIIRDNKRLAEDRMERFSESSFQRVSSLEYREKPLLTIALAGIAIIGIGLLALALAFPTASDEFGWIILISVITVIGSGFISIIAALFMLKRR